MRKILFIGNSYTYFNDMPEIFRGIAEAAGQEVSVLSVTEGGCTLMRHLDESTEIGLKVKQALSEPWDDIILQEHSRGRIIGRPDFFAGVAAFSDAAKRLGARLHLYMTWGYKPGHPFYAETGFRPDGMAFRIAEGYELAGRLFGVDVDPVGRAFSLCRKEYPDIELYDPDMTHPSLAGSCLSAAVHYISLFGADSASLPSGMDEDTSAKLWDIASRVCGGRTPSKK